MTEWIFRLFVALAVAVSLLGADEILGSPYDTAVLQDNPVMYLPLSAATGASAETDRSGRGHNGHYFPVSSNFSKAPMPNGDRATVFNGTNQYIEVPTSVELSVRRGAGLTLEAWIRPDTLDFTYDEGDGYVHWAGKGAPGQHEYALRMYSRTNTASPARPNRISGYAFNLVGGLGSGSYFQDPVTVGGWIHVAVVINTRVRPGVISIYKNGVLRKTTPLSQFDVVPRPGNAPLRIGTRDFGSFFRGAIGKFAIYAYPLTQAKIAAHTARMQ